MKKNDKNKTRFKVRRRIRVSFFWIFELFGDKNLIIASIWNYAINGGREWFWIVIFSACALFDVSMYDFAKEKTYTWYDTVNITKFFAAIFWMCILSTIACVVGILIAIIDVIIMVKLKKHMFF